MDLKAARIEVFIGKIFWIFVFTKKLLWKILIMMRWWWWWCFKSFLVPTASLKEEILEVKAEHVQDVSDGQDIWPTKAFEGKLGLKLRVNVLAFWTAFVWEGCCCALEVDRTTPAHLEFIRTCPALSAPTWKYVYNYLFWWNFNHGYIVRINLCPHRPKPFVRLFSN